MGGDVEARGGRPATADQALGVPSADLGAVADAVCRPVPLGAASVERSRRSVRISWLTYLDPFGLSGAGELHNRLLIETGRRRGHQITVSPWLRGRAQRMMRRARLTRRVPIDWDADLF